MGLGQKFLTRVRSGRVNFLWLGSGQPFTVWVWNWKISPKNVKFFNFFPLSQKKNLFGLGRKVPGLKVGRPLIYCGSKVSLCQVTAHLYSLTRIVVNKAKPETELEMIISLALVVNKSIKWFCKLWISCLSKVTKTSKLQP